MAFITIHHDGMEYRRLLAFEAAVMQGIEPEELQYTESLLLIVQVGHQQLSKTTKIQLT
jgi:hypothetical protein